MEESGLYENIFSPRIMLFPVNTSDSLKLDFYLPDINLTEKELLKEFNKQKQVDEQRTFTLQQYKQAYLPNRSLKFVEKAKYVNENFMVLQPYEKKIITLLFDPKIYKNEGDFKGIGFPVKKDGRYNVLVKIHTDSDKTWFYLNDKNKKLIMKNKVKLISENFYLQRLILNVN